MSLQGKTAWVIGGVGVVGRGIARGLLKAGATVIVNSRASDRLETVAKDLGHPERLVLIKGSMLPGYASKTVSDTLSHHDLHHVVAHGAVRYWSNKQAASAADESFSLLGNQQNILDSIPAVEFKDVASHLASLHFSAAQELVSRLPQKGGSYTFVTGDGGGHASGKRSSMGDINSHHVWGLSAALRSELSRTGIRCREIRVELPINRPEEERAAEPRDRPLSENIGDLCAGLASHAKGDTVNGAMADDQGRMLRLQSQSDIEEFLKEYDLIEDKKVAEQLPIFWETAGSV